LYCWPKSGIHIEISIWKIEPWPDRNTGVYCPMVSRCTSIVCGCQSWLHNFPSRVGSRYFDSDSYGYTCIKNQKLKSCIFLFCNSNLLVEMNFHARNGIEASTYVQSIILIIYVLSSIKLILWKLEIFLIYMLHTVVVMPPFEEGRAYCFAAVCLLVCRFNSSFCWFSSHWLHILKRSLVYRFIIRISRSKFFLGTIEQYLTEFCPLDLEKFK
jgi:hypothetical protein